MKPLLLAFTIAVTPALAAPDAALKKKLEADLAAADEALKKGPPSVALYSRRGDANFFAGKFPEALADYEKMVELDPKQRAMHWRLGISYYLNGEFEKGAKLFEEYHQHDDVDRENGIWHFLCRAGIDGVGSAQLQMLRYSKPDREPMELIYELLAGIIKTDEFFRTLQKRGLLANQQAIFYARFYAAIHEDLNGRPEQAKKFMRMAAESEWAKKATGGPGYMAQVARLLLDAMESAPAEETEKKP